MVVLLFLFSPCAPFRRMDARTPSENGRCSFRDGIIICSRGVFGKNFGTPKPINFVRKERTLAQSSQNIALKPLFPKAASRRKNSRFRREFLFERKRASLFLFPFARNRPSFALRKKEAKRKEKRGLSMRQGRGERARFLFAVNKIADLRIRERKAEKEGRATLSFRARRKKG